MRTEKLNAIKGAIKDGKTVQAAGGIAVTMQQSDKLGYDWKVYSVTRKLRSDRLSGPCAR